MLGYEMIIYHCNSLFFSLNKTRNPEPWERVDPTKPQKVVYWPTNFTNTA